MNSPQEQTQQGAPVNSAPVKPEQSPPEQPPDSAQTALLEAPPRIPESFLTAKHDRPITDKPAPTVPRPWRFGQKRKRIVYTFFVPVAPETQSSADADEW